MVIYRIINESRLAVCRSLAYSPKAMRWIFFRQKSWPVESSAFTVPWLVNKKSFKKKTWKILKHTDSSIDLVRWTVWMQAASHPRTLWPPFRASLSQKTSEEQTKFRNPAIRPESTPMDVALKWWKGPTICLDQPSLLDKTRPIYCIIRKMSAQRF